MKQNFIAQFVQLLKHWLCTMWSGIVAENWALSVDQCWLLMLLFQVHLIDLLNILRCNGFTRIQKTIVDWTGSRLPNSNHDPFFGACLALFLHIPTTELVVAGYHIKSTFCHTSNPIKKWFVVVAQNKRRGHFKVTIFLICSQLMRHTLTKLFHLFNLLQVPNNHRMVDTEFLGDFSCGCKRISCN